MLSSWMPLARNSYKTTIQRQMTTTSCDVVILGAGMVGVRAAQVLLETTPKNIALRVLLLEARDVVGGRIRWKYATQSDMTSDTSTTDEPPPPPPPPLYLDMGAQFIHHVSETHRMCQLAAQCHVPYRKVNFYQTCVYDDKTRLPLTREQIGAAQQAMGQMYALLDQERENSTSLNQDTPLEDFMEPLWEKIESDDEARRHARALMRMLFRVDLAEDVQDLSALYFDQDDDDENESNEHAVPYNYQRLVEHMAAEPRLPQHCLCLQHEVQHVNFHDENDNAKGVTVTCRRTDTMKRCRLTPSASFVPCPWAS